jgi:PAS domain S-box-containing protein
MKSCEEFAKYKDKMFNKEVIVATSNEPQKNFFKKHFEKEGYSVTTLSDATMLQDVCKQSSCGILILDLSLQSVDGRGALFELSQNCCNKRFVIVNKNDKKLHEALFEYGIIDYYDENLPLHQIFEDIKTELLKVERNKGFKILIAENAPKIKQQLQTILTPRGFTPKFVGDGKNLFDTLKAYDPDLILLDTNLPDIDANKALAKLMDSPYADTPIVVISQSEDLELFSKVLKHGAKDYIKKPFILDEVLIKVDMWVEMAFRKYQRDCKEKLLNEYKEAIDESTIVSKTDTKGVITYVNKAFCKISGYEESELMGKPHNIVRHPDMPKYAFKDMWETIQSGKIWRGIVKNRCKNGDHYYVETIIKPIVDPEGKISEYIGIRTDITQIQNIKENLQKRLNITNKSFQEVLSLSKEYENALDESTIVSRTDLEGKIIYANDKFYEITGFSKAEVIGKTHNIVRHEENPDSFYEHMWATIKAGKIWRGTIKNRKKNKEEYIVNSLIYPVKNSSGRVVEYMAIRNDITDIVKLHKEIEHTQREVIYKMGEVGESRSKETGDHVKRVAEYSYLLAKKAGLSEKTAKLLKSASPMHDIGKVGIPDSILLKPAKLTKEEFEIMKTHTEIGYSVLKNSSRELLQTAATVAYEHHEKFDGSGYPRGLKGEQIHIFGRITAVADVFDALGHDRVYKKAWELDRILELFKEERGKHFDPKLVDLLLENIDEFLEIKKLYAD